MEPLLLHLLTELPQWMAVILIMAVYISRAIFKYFIHGKAIRSDDVDKIIKILQTRDDKLSEKISALESQVEHWRNEYYKLRDQHQALEQQCRELEYRLKCLEYEKSNICPKEVKASHQDN